MKAMHAESTVLVLVDYQARLMPAIHDAAEMASRAVLLGQAAQLLDVPVIGTEQNPAGLGPNVEQIACECASTLAKTHFDACADGLVEALQAARPGCSQVVVAGCEAHVCLLQTALGLLRAGLRVWVVADASGSRRPSDHAAAMQRLAQAGATVVTHEMVAFRMAGGLPACALQGRAEDRQAGPFGLNSTNRMRGPQPMGSRSRTSPRSRTMSRLQTIAFTLCLTPALALAQMATAPFEGRLKRSRRPRPSPWPTAPMPCPSRSRTTTRSPAAIWWTCAAASLA